jgi:transposase-like protein
MERRFSSEEKCIEYLRAIRWPDGFECARCASGKAWQTSRGLWVCSECDYHASIKAGTIFEGSHLPLSIWFRAMWHVTSQKNGMSALGLQRILGLGSYRTAWMLLHKLRRAMVRPERDRLQGVVEVDETFWGATEGHVRGRLVDDKALIAVAAEEDGSGIGRIRMARIPDTSRKVLHGFIHKSVKPGSIVRTDGWRAYLQMKGYQHDRQVQRQRPGEEHLMPRAHLAVSLLKRWLIGTHQGATSHAHLDDYLNEFTFRFNRRKSRSRGKLFFRLAQISVQVPPAPYSSLVAPQHIVGA